MVYDAKLWLGGAEILTHISMLSLYKLQAGRAEC